MLPVNLNHVTPTAYAYERKIEIVKDHEPKQLVCRIIEVRVEIKR